MRGCKIYTLYEPCQMSHLRSRPVDVLWALRPERASNPCVVHPNNQHIDSRGFRSLLEMPAFYVGVRNQNLIWRRNKLLTTYPLGRHTRWKGQMPRRVDCEDCSLAPDIRFYLRRCTCVFQTYMHRLFVRILPVPRLH